MNINCKNALVIGGSALFAGGVIFGVTKLAEFVKSKRTKPEEKETVEETEE